MSNVIKSFEIGPFNVMFTSEVDGQADVSFYGEFVNKPPTEGWFVDRKRGVIFLDGIDEPEEPDEFEFEEKYGHDYEDKYCDAWDKWREDFDTWYENYGREFRELDFNCHFRRNEYRYIKINDDVIDSNSDKENNAKYAIQAARRLCELDVWWWPEIWTCAIFVGPDEVVSNSVAGIESDMDDESKKEIMNDLYNNCVAQLDTSLSFEHYKHKTLSLVYDSLIKDNMSFFMKSIDVSKIDDGEEIRTKEDLDGVNSNQPS